MRLHLAHAGAGANRLLDALKGALDLKVGDKVVMRIGGGERRGVVIEDRGKLGRGGRQIVVVRVGSETEGRRFEARAEDLERVAA